MKKPKNIKGLRGIFESSLQEVSKVLDKPPHLIKRDEYVRVTVDNKITPRLNKQELNDLGGFKVARELFFPTPETATTENSKEEITKEEIVNKFTDYLKYYKTVPTLLDFEKYSNIKASDIKKHYKSTQDLYELLAKQHPETEKYVLNETSFTQAYYDDLLGKIKKYKRFIITTAVNNKRVHEGFLNSLKNYAKRKDALILVLPCQDAFNRKTAYEWNLDPVLSGCEVVFKDTYLNKNLFVSDIKVSAKMLLPTSGLARLAQGRGSMVLASPKQFLEYVPISNNKLPIAIMTTGSVTEEDYSSDYYMSMRLSKLAEHDHTIGAILVEVQDEKIFHFRQVQASESGSFTDLGVVYNPDGTIDGSMRPVAIFGDSHVTVKDNDVHSVVKDIVEELGIHDVILQDIADNECISHHIQNKPSIKATNYMNGISSIEKEGREVAKYLDEVSSWIDGDVTVVRSNHDAFLDRYLEEGRFVSDPPNFYYCLDICKAMMEGDIPLRFLIEDKIGLNPDTKVNWLDYDDDHIVYGAQVVHGHLGPNGSKGSAKNLDRCYVKSWLGHSHTPCIYRGVYQVGTLSKLKLNYNRGVSSWVNCIGISYIDGSRQLVNIIANPDGSYSWRI